MTSIPHILQAFTGVGAPDQSRAGAEPQDRFASLGVYGFAKRELPILAALVTEDPLLLIGRSGTG